MRPETTLRAVLIACLAAGAAASAVGQETVHREPRAELPGVPYEESSRYLVKLVGWERYGPSFDDYRFRFWVRDKRDGAEARLELDNRTNELRELHILDDPDRLVVIGGIRNVADVVTIFDLEQAREVDSFLAYGPELSSTQRYVIYKRFYPRFSEPPATSDVVLVYDLAATPSANRLEDAEQIGIPVYPEENVRAETVSAWVEAEEKRHSIDPAVEYLWLENDRRVGFVDRSGGDTYVVVVDLSQGLDSPEIQKKMIDVGSLLSIDPDSEDYEAILERERRRLQIASLRRSEEGSIVVVFDREKWAVEDLYRWSQIEIPLPIDGEGRPPG